MAVPLPYAPGFVVETYRGVFDRSLTFAIVCGEASTEFKMTWAELVNEPGTAGARTIERCFEAVERLWSRWMAL